MIDAVDRAVILKRLTVNNYIFQKYGGVVQHGPLRDFKILQESSWGNDKAAKILGFYEAEILEELSSEAQGKYFVDIGAADGYYAVGFLYKKICVGCVAFESTEQGRQVITNTAKFANITLPLLVYDSAQSNFINLVPFPLDQTVFLIDIEGGEFEILTEENLFLMRQSIIFVEIHDSDDSGKEKFQRLLRDCEKHFLVKIQKRVFRDPYAYPELDELDDTEHWLACSEGRAPDAKWLILRPKIYK